MANAYFISQINKALFSSLHSKSKNSAPSSLPLTIVFLHYIQGIIGHTSMIMGKRNIKTIIKPLKNHLELLRINLIQCLVKELTKLFSLVTNHTLTKLVDLLKPSSRNIKLSPSTITFLSYLSLNILTFLNT